MLRFTLLHTLCRPIAKCFYAALAKSKNFNKAMSQRKDPVAWSWSENHQGKNAAWQRRWKVKRNNAINEIPITTEIRNEMLTAICRGTRKTYRRGQKAEWMAFWFHPFWKSKQEGLRETADTWEVGRYTLLSRKPQGFRTSSKWRVTF